MIRIKLDFLREHANFHQSSELNHHCGAKKHQIGENWSQKILETKKI
jgi:hypothetical protein